MVSLDGGRRIWDDYCKKGFIPDEIKDLIDEDEDFYLEYYLPVGYARKYGYSFEEKDDLEDLNPNMKACTLDILTKFKVI